MSLVTLTFGHEKAANAFTSNPHIGVHRPMDDLHIDPAVENKARVRKIAQFLGDDEVYLICEIVSGVVAEKMHADCHAHKLCISELECKYPGSKIAKKGMTVGISVSGIAKADVKEGETITFSPY